MKILHVGEYVNGGVATYLRTLLSGLQKYDDVENYLLISEYKSQQGWEDITKKVFYYKYKRSISNIFSAIKQIHAVIKDVNPDIIHAHSTWAGLFVRLPYLFKKRKAKIIYQSHGWAFLMDTSNYKKNIYALVEKILSIPTDRIINISNYEQNQAVKCGLNKNKMVMIYNGVEDKVNKSNLKLNWDENKINLLFVGRLDRQKGLDLFLDVYDKMKLENLHLYVIGTSVLDDNLPNSTKYVTYLGWVNNKDIDAYYQACDAVIMPSRWEGFGLVAIEAMKNSKAVIVSNRGALPELIKEDFTGYIFNIDDEISLKNRLLSLDKERLNILGENSRTIYLQKFVDKIFINKMYKIYKVL
ncbi:Capsular glucan synthase [Megamonas hypermegale]|uniref:Capsular glucan synthase n=1 Tax=Megamonas hypermegale TaxID=158847 RepID=A0A239U9D3_9FIRM|nr:glycosyltransferase family 4 protein [Megamonas hypermegale]SNV05603.1 Capsular glucan synthase [Megamonas hypermegale]